MVKHSEATFVLPNVVLSSFHFLGFCGGLPSLLQRVYCWLCDHIAWHSMHEWCTLCMLG